MAVNYARLISRVPRILSRRFAVLVETSKHKSRPVFAGVLVAFTGAYVLYRSSKLKAKAGSNDKKPSCTVCDLSEGAGSLPPLTLYQYETCPFCNKVRAVLDYYDIQYSKVEVNPLFKKEIKFSTDKHVPFVMVGDTQVCDSSLIVSLVRSCFVGTGSVEETLALYPEVVFTDAKGRERVERANKYFVMFGDAKQIDERREEREWRQWVDEELVHTLAPNIYRTPSEALQAMRYISSISNFGFFERVAAKYAGAAAMYLLGKKLKKKYELKDDVRQSLFDCANQWLEAVGPNRQFLGGSSPNLADLAVYGVLHAIEDQPAFGDLQKIVKIAPWYSAVQKEVTEHKGRALIVASK